MVKKRALRRYHRARMYKRAKKVLWWHDERLGYNTREEAHRAVSRARDNLCNCSCWSCGNPRRVGWNSSLERLTLQERKEFERYEYDMGEVVDLFTGKPYGEAMKVYCVPLYDRDDPRYSHAGFKAVSDDNVQLAIAPTVVDLKEKVANANPLADITFVEMFDEGELA